jgi:hypothetical protein
MNNFNFFFVIFIFTECATVSPLIQFEINYLLNMLQLNEIIIHIFIQKLDNYMILMIMIIRRSLRLDYILD